MSDSRRGDLTTALLDHFDAVRRAMPWRETSDPYAIWVSEVMLQQTRVDTVIPYWERWVDRFPTVDELAEAPLQDVLKAWEGLGYYSRARRLHSAARVVRERYGGRVPREPEELRELPGVGEYTAGAVASIAYGAAVPAVDGNARRVLARLYDIEQPTPRQLRERAAALVPDDRPGDFNQALMELGATVCTPVDPDCPACPVAGWCEARRRGVQELRPRPGRRKPVPTVEVRTLILVRPDGAVLLSRRPDEGLLGGLWEFPTPPFPDPLAELLDPPDDAAAPDGIGPATRLDPVHHTLSHRRLVYLPELRRVTAALGVGDEERRSGRGAGRAAPTAIPDGGPALRWVDPGRLSDYPRSVAQQKIERQVLEALGVGGR